jgi:zinc transporter 1/2/3
VSSCAYAAQSVLFSADPHGHTFGGHAAHGPEGEPAVSEDQKQPNENLKTEDGDIIGNSALTQIIGVAILEFGIALHRCVVFQVYQW